MFQSIPFLGFEPKASEYFAVENKPVAVGLLSFGEGRKLDESTFASYVGIG